MSSQEPILPQIGFASDLDVEERAQFGNFGELVSLSEGDVLIDERHEQDSLFLVIMGTLHVQTDVTGRSILLGTVKAGDTIGEVSIFDPGNASASVVARSITEVWKIDRERLEQYLEAHPRTAVQVLIRIATQLSKRLRTTNEKVAMAREAMLDSF